MLGYPEIILAFASFTLKSSPFKDGKYDLIYPKNKDKPGDSKS